MRPSTAVAEAVILLSNHLISFILRLSSSSSSFLSTLSIIELAVRFAASGPTSTPLRLRDQAKYPDGGDIIIVTGFRWPGEGEEEAESADERMGGIRRERARMAWSLALALAAVAVLGAGHVEAHKNGCSMYGKKAERRQTIGFLGSPRDLSP